MTFKTATIFLLSFTAIIKAYANPGIYSGKSTKFQDANKYIENRILGKSSSRSSEVSPLPFLFAVPKSVQADLGNDFRAQNIVFDYYHSISKDKEDKNKIGLRLIVVNNSEQRKSIAQKLGKSGLIQDGDVILTYHPEWGGTGAYPNLMTGISHSGMAFIEDGTQRVRNIDMPLNQAQNFQEHTANSPSYLSSNHYMKHTPFMHILRPRISQRERDNLKAWAELFFSLVRGSGGRTAYPYPLRFNSSYLAPAYMLHKKLDNKEDNLVAHILDVGRAARGKSLVYRYKNLKNGNLERSLPLFCSDFIWSLQALRNCDLQESMNECKPEPMFRPIGLIGQVDPSGDESKYIPGSTDAAFLILKALDIRDDDKRDRLIDEIFQRKFPYKNISSGHRNAAKDIPQQLYGALAAYWKTYFRGGDVSPYVAALNASDMPDNYAPTTFLINALLPNDNESKKYDYVGTVAFVSARHYQNVKNKLVISQTAGISEEPSSSSTGQQEPSTKGNDE